jgi:predicted MFS family arabinose efflux permease
METTQTRSTGKRRYVLFILAATYGLSHIDRQIMSILMEPVKRDLALSDTQLGLLAGLGFAVFYALVGIPMAMWADRGNRRNIIALSVAVWSGMTALCGMSATFAQLALARVGVGIGEAGANPAAHSLIADLYAQDERSRALGLYSSAINVGALLGLFIGGWVSQFSGWRNAFLFVGLPGLIVALIVRFTFREPLRARTGGASGADAPSLRATLRFIGATPALRNIFIAHVAAVFVVYALGQWQPSYLARTWHLSRGEIGTMLGLMVGVIGFCGTALGGVIATRLVRRDVRWYNWFPAISLIVSAASLLGVLASASLAAAACFYAVWAFTQTMFLAPDYAVIQGIVMPRSRAVVVAVLFLTTNLIGYGLGPQIVGALSDVFKPEYGADSLRMALAVATSLSLIGGLFYLLAARHVRAHFAASGAARLDVVEPAAVTRHS